MIAVDTECNGLFIHKGCRAFTISAACDQNKSYLWNFPVDPFTREVTYTPSVFQNFKDTIAQHKEIIFHNANFDIQALVAAGIDFDYLFDNHDIHDTMVMSHAYHSPGPHGLKPLGVTLLSFPEDDEARLSDITKAAQKEAKKLEWSIASKSNPHPTLRGNQDSWHKADYWIPAQVAKALKYPKSHPWHTICNEYAEKDAIRTIGIFYIFQELMTEQQMQSYHKARRLIKPILQMQYEKVTLLKDKMEESYKEFSTKKAISLIKLRKLVGDREFNPGSPQQLSNVLFNKYKFKTDRVGDSGNPSTDKHVIGKLLKDVPSDTDGPLPPRFQFLLGLKKLRKEKTTLQYLSNYESHRNDRFELHPTFKQTATGTNRLSCENPNTTNVGSANMNDADDYNEEEDDSFRLRDIFGPRPKELWTCIDYTQSQLLIFAVVSGSTQLVDAYLQGIDLHEATAMQIFGIDDPSSVTKEQRRAAKNVNFGILFGAGPAKIEQTAGIPGLYSTALKRLPGTKKFLAKSEAEARAKGYVHTLGGYRLYVPRERPYAASCYIIQGTEAEIVRDAMVDVSTYTYSNKPCPYRMIMMVHDEIVLRSKRTSEPHLRKIIKLMMNAGLKVGVPAKVDADLVRHNWAEKEPLELAI
jgi:DNA polymerase I-like protein with 3'-5' exonuclease and polymerase domains